jgi:hypothetical protein
MTKQFNEATVNRAGSGRFAVKTRTEPTGVVLGQGSRVADSLMNNWEMLSRHSDTARENDDARMAASVDRQRSARQQLPETPAVEVATAKRSLWHRMTGRGK